MRKRDLKKKNILFYSDCTHYPISTCTCNLDTATANPYEHVSDTPTSVRAEVQHENYCTFLHIWMMLRSIELFPEDGSPVGRTPFILSVLTLRSSHPLGGFPPRPPPSFSRLLLARRKYFHDKSRYTRVFMPRWRRPRRRWGFPRLRHRFFSAPHTRSLPPLSLLYHEVEWN